MDSSVLQEDELTALDSIYPGLVQVLVAEERILTLTIPISLALPTVTHLLASSASPEALPSVSEATLRLQHLPPLSARLALPPTYPLTAPPRVLSLRAPLPGERGAWLSRRILSHVQDRLGALWAAEAAAGEGAGVLWSWWEWIGTGAFLEDTGLLVDHVLTLTTPPRLPASTLHLQLRAHDTTTARADFEGTAFPCAICFENRKGRQSVQLPQCGCFACLRSFWTLAIQEGTLDNVVCPSVQCVKARVGETMDHAAGAYAVQRADGISLDVVASVVGQEMAERWQMLSEKRLVDTNPDYTFCPRKLCQAAVPPSEKPSAVRPAPKQKVIRLDIRRPNPNSTDDDRPFRPPPPDPHEVNDKWDNCRTCPRCKYTFCLVCRGVWHGVHTPCQFGHVAQVVKEYLEASDTERAAMEKRLGPKGTEALQALVREHEREVMFKEWVNDNATVCPKCEASIQKSEGCNHMKCPFCSVHFCYRCGQQISHSDPYKHFRESSTCAGKLFDPIEGDDAGWIPMDVFFD